MSASNFVLRSPPCDIYWLGWKGNSVDLQRHGWDFSVSKNEYTCSYRMAIRNKEAQVHGISSWFDATEEHRNHISLHASLIFGMEMARDIHIPITSLMTFQAVDMEPEVVQMEPNGYMSKSNIFKPATHIEPYTKTKTNRIITLKGGDNG